MALFVYARYYCFAWDNIYKISADMLWIYVKMYFPSYLNNYFDALSRNFFFAIQKRIVMRVKQNIYIYSHAMRDATV